MRGMNPRVPAAEITAFGRELLVRAGMDEDKSLAVAEVLVEADLLGHTTHGLALLAPYLEEIGRGGMARSGQPEVVADFPAVVTWDGRRMPGPWLVRKALDLAMERAERNGLCAVTIRRSHHIACLAAFLRPVAERGLVAILTCSDPAVATVAPFGGRKGLFTPNPIAAAWPTDADPVILDFSASITTNALTKRLHAAGRRFPGPWALDAAGVPTDDPAALFAEPPGTLLPAGGADHGHKGYALALLVEALTSALAGHGRADPPEGWGASVFLQVINPACLGGAEAFRREAGHLAVACRENPPRPGVERVRLPGETGLNRRRLQLADGVELHPSTLPALRPWAERFGVDWRFG